MDEILPYAKVLKTYARTLRKEMTLCEQLPWGKLRRRQICGVQFNRQKPIGPFIIDFYAKDPKLAIELDGSQHETSENKAKDENRDFYLTSLGIYVLRFSNVEVLQAPVAVLSKIEHVIMTLTSAHGHPPPA